MKIIYGLLVAIAGLVFGMCIGDLLAAVWGLT
jgi:hypothetical protein